MRVLVAAIAFAMLGSAHADPVPVTFLGSPCDHLSIGNQGCRVPCTLELMPGDYQLFVTGPGGRTRVPLTVPHQPATLDIPAFRKRIFGIALTIIGGVWGLLGTAMMIAHFAADDPKRELIDLGIIGLSISGAASIPATILFATMHHRTLPGTIQIGRSSSFSPTGNGFAFEF